MAGPRATCSRLTSSLADRWVDLVVGSRAGIEERRGRVARRPREAARGGAEEPAIVRVRTKGVAVSLGGRRSVPRADSAGAAPEDRHADIVAVVDDDPAVSVGRAGRLPGEGVDRRRIASGRYTVDIDVLAIGVDPDPVLHIPASRAI
jgi:hypothetical protein